MDKQSLAKTTKDILNKYNIKLNKNLGQNYLIDRNKRDQIIDFGNITKEDIVLEIGPGIGTLTCELASKAKKVIAIDERRTAEEFGVTKMLIDGVEYPFVLTHNDYWFVVDIAEPLLGKTVEFV